MTYGKTARYWRDDLAAFDRRWPGRVHYAPANTQAAHGRDLTLAMVGPRPEVVQRPYIGPKTISLDTPRWVNRWNAGSQVIFGRSFTDCVITADAAELGVLFVDCTFDGTTFNGDGSGVSFLHCDFDARTKAARVEMWHAVYILSYTAENCLFRGWDAALRVGVDCLIDRCLFIEIKDKDPAIDQHQSCVSAQQVNISGSTMRRSKLLAAHGSDPLDDSGISAAITHYNDGTHTGLVIEDNYIATAAFYGMYGGAQASKADPFSTNLKVRGNVFGRDFARYCGSTAAARAFNNADPANEWSNNTWGPLGPFNLAGDPAEGVLISAPGPGA